jgi:hypothetical protein
MTENPLVKWAESELKRLEREEKREESRRAYDERERTKRDRYLNAPIMGLDGKIIKKST